MTQQIEEPVSTEQNQKDLFRNQSFGLPSAAAR